MNDDEFFGLTRRKFTENEIQRIAEYLAKKLAGFFKDQTNE